MKSINLSLEDFNYNLPKHLIAQTPIKPRDHARLLCLGRFNGNIRHRRFDDLKDELQPGDVLVINDSKVFPARLMGRKDGSGGQVEIFLHKFIKDGRWECLVGGRVHPNLKIIFSHGLWAVLEKDQGDGTWLVFFSKSGQEFWHLLDQIGQVPLPPYIQGSGRQKLDRLRYQTVYAQDNHKGSVAAPTAGLHFTNRMLAKLRQQGVNIVPVTLHVGLGTFAAVKETDITKHQMHSEFMSISAEATKVLVAAKKQKRRIVAVGTTSCRVLESYGQEISRGRLSLGETYQGWTNIFIYPGYQFILTDALITNFHLPKSSLLMLVSAFAGQKAVMEAYRQAIQENYRFYSYGDAMFIG
ncbi:MAG: S-adenosylmethionine:tRNA ribosyltransferase-isomerase [Parcubacteria group bacterium ADurb.Bin115]|jgi:S-adenosylmethionine:tRNA ribosyltransferase-isomerase|nr:MAG: S-adenosylmethionine:tRNA ribosyltransferase-isomerase [Parcubacteria group bacterium ADurb.Bin115]